MEEHSVAIRLKHFMEYSELSTRSLLIGVGFLVPHYRSC